METGSTNADMLEAAALKGAAEGLWLRAERQTAGRGRMGRTWISEPGNLYASTLVRLRPGDPPAPTLAFVGGVALDGVFIKHFATMLKWPNDLMAFGPEGEALKLGGILLERVDDAVVAGFGVNLANAPRLDRPVTSFAEQASYAIDASELLVALAERFTFWLERWREDLSKVIVAWESAAHLPGTALTVSLPGGEQIDGAFDGLAADGALLLRLADGGIRAIHAGDVFLV